MIAYVINFIEKHYLIEPDEKVLVGVSGGADSICLLHILHEISFKMNFQIIAMHINHLLRDEESDEDARFVKKICDGLKITCIQMNIDIREEALKRKKGIEETARDIRYREFEKYAMENDISKIAVAHNQNDQAETVLMNLIRGSGLTGLKGMKPIMGKIVRPLLNIPRDQIEEFLIKNSISFRVDSSNLSTDYSRNKIRLELIPWIEQNLNSGIVKHLAKTAEILKYDEDIIENYVNSQIEMCLTERRSDKIMFDKDVFLEFSKGMQARIIRLFIKFIRGNLKEIKNIHIDNLMKLFQGSQSGSSVNLPGNIIGGVSFSTLWISNLQKSEDKNLKPVKLEIPGSVHILDNCELIAIVKKNDKSIERNKDIMYNLLEQIFDFDLVPKDLYIRNMQQGDYIKSADYGCSKKLRKYFMEKKISAEERKIIPIVAAENEVIWVVGQTINYKYTVTKNTQRILKLCFKECKSV